jgi:hypothetical protein
MKLIKSTNKRIPKCKVLSKELNAEWCSITKKTKVLKSKNTDHVNNKTRAVWKLQDPNTKLH